MVTIRAKPKHYGPLQIDDTGAAGITLQTSTGATLNTGTVADARTMPPGDLIMAALGSCLTISLQMAAQSEGITTGKVSMAVEAFIDGGEPRRFNRFTAHVSMAGISDRDTAMRLLARAKQLCTVSHTLNADIKLEFID